MFTIFPLTTLLDETGSRTVINHNPLPDITHEEFVSLLGPLLVPENYAFTNGPSSPPLSGVPSAQPGPSPSSVSSWSPAPLDWLHFEGRSVKTTLNNIVGIDGLARERKWRSHCVFSLDVSRKSRQGVEAVRFFSCFQNLPLTLLLPAHPAR